MDFTQWMAELRQLAEDRGGEFLISNDDEDHRESFDDGLSPADEFYEQYVIACETCT